jgi:hypothetical protein
VNTATGDTSTCLVKKLKNGKDFEAILPEDVFGPTHLVKTQAMNEKQQARIRGIVGSEFVDLFDLRAGRGKLLCLF